MKARHRNQDDIPNHVTGAIIILLLSYHLHSFPGESVYEEGSFWGAIQFPMPLASVLVYTTPRSNTGRGVVVSACQCATCTAPLPLLYSPEPLAKPCGTYSQHEVYYHADAQNSRLFALATWTTANFG